MKLYNTLSKQLEEFKPIVKGMVKIYSCGPTVYSNPTIGNWRAFIFADILVRSFRFLGYDVFNVMNITDVGHIVGDIDKGEDKLEKQAKIDNLDVWAIAKKYTDVFLKDRDRLNILPPSVLAKATDHIQEQIKLIEILLEKGYAYRTDEAIYFDVTKFPLYYNLSGQKTDELMDNSRDNLNESVEKKSQKDFRLWQLDDPTHQMLWDSPWGKGYPGWHIECSAMSMKYLGDEFDIHTGGSDLIFPHHTNEIAQSDSIAGKQVVHYWLHNAFITINGEKMSKSKNNFYTLDDVESILNSELKANTKYAPEALRYLFLSGNYRSMIDFSKEAILNAYRAIYGIIRQIRLFAEDDSATPLRSTSTHGSVSPVYDMFSNEYLVKLKECLEDDINTSKAIALIHDILKRNDMASKEKISNIYAIGSVLGFDFNLMVEASNSKDEEYNELINRRSEAKNIGDYSLSDKLKQDLEEKGFEVIDMKNNRSCYILK